MPNDDIIVTLVKMPFTAEDKHAIKILRKEKQYSSRRLLNEFPSKNWTRRGLDNLLKKIDNTGSSRPRAVRTGRSGPRTESRRQAANPLFCQTDIARTGYSTFMCP